MIPLYLKPWHFDIEMFTGHGIFLSAPDDMAAQAPQFISGSLRFLRPRANICLYNVPRAAFISPK